MQERKLPPRDDFKTVEIRRPDSSHPWGICYAVLPGGPEILKIMDESPAYGHLHSGQVIRTINGQSVLGLKREDIIELLNIDDEVVVLEVTKAVPIDSKFLQFAREYGRGSVEPGGYRRNYRRNSEMSVNMGHRGSNVCVAMPTNLPNCRDEFERIHLQRKRSRELTLNQLENLRLQRAASVGVVEGEPNRDSAVRPQPSTGLLSSSQQNQNGQTQNDLEALPETPKEEDNGMSSIRYMGVNIPSRSFRALASLMGMDPSGANMDQVDTKPATKEPCRTVIDVKAAAEEMRKESLQHENNNSLPPHPPPAFNSSLKAL
ncbi:hypothetical protein Aperf_G00000000899 [Anoplocephala perfoliata]